MYRFKPRHQLSLEDFFLPFGGKLSGDNRWINLADVIPWDELEDDYAAQFCKGFGAPAKPFRTRGSQALDWSKPQVVSINHPRPQRPVAT